jgi:hypothetical protein
MKIRRRGGKKKMEASKQKDLLLGGLEESRTV